MNTVHDLRPKPKKRTIVIGIVIILILALAVVAVVMLSRPQTTDTGLHGGLFKSSYPGGFKFTIGGMSEKTLWGDMKILLQNGSATKAWNLTTAGLTGSAGKTFNGASWNGIGGSKTVWMNVTDKIGNGYVDGGDYISFEPNTAFSAASSYTLTLIYVPTGSEMTHATFTG